jgi:Uri superfamily endonuclease
MPVPLGTAHGQASKTQPAHAAWPQVPTLQSRCTSRCPRSVTFEPPLDLWPDHGVYQLWLRVSVDLRVTVGRLGRFRFPAGRYVYTGRAARGLRARVLRHVRGAVRKHWHIDYLLAYRAVRIGRVTLASDNPQDECIRHQGVAGRVRCVAAGFGSSDCRARCSAHLWLVGRSPGPAD